MKVLLLIVVALLVWFAFVWLITYKVRKPFIALEKALREQQKNAIMPFNGTE